MHAMNAKVSMDRPDISDNACLAFCCVFAFLTFGASFNRARIRSKYNIKYFRNHTGCYCIHHSISCFSCLLDILVSALCPCCAVVQEWREVMERERNDNQMTFWKLSFKSSRDSAATFDSEAQSERQIPMESDIPLESDAPMLSSVIEIYYIAE
jgi:hypothetical protein